MAKGPSIEALMARAQKAIDEDDTLIYDVAGETGQIVGNVKHMSWFKRAVAEWLTENTEQWASLHGSIGRTAEPRSVTAEEIIGAAHARGRRRGRAW